MEFKNIGRIRQQNGVLCWGFLYKNQYEEIVCLRDDETIPSSTIFTGMPVSHLQIGIRKNVNGQKIEPSYKEKVKILRSTGRWKNIGVEVFPSQDEVVDREDIYHVWEFEYQYSTPFFSIAQKALREKWKVGNYLSFPHRVIVTRLEKWRDKQQLKNRYFGINSIAVEFIAEEFVGFYSIIVEVPYLDFGLL